MKRNLFTLILSISFAVLLNSQPFNELQKLFPDSGPFARSLSIDEGWLFVGVDDDDENGSNVGSVYIYKRNGNSWIFHQKVFASDGDTDDNFGNAVSVQGDHAVIGAYGDEENGEGSGSIYVFTNNLGNWEEEVKLFPPDLDPNDKLGESVSIHGNYIVAGASGDDDYGSSSGAAYIFQYDNNQWTYLQKITANDAEIDDSFGSTVAIYEHDLIVGSPKDDFYSGAAYVFKNFVGSWVQQNRLTAPDRQYDSQFGYSVDICKNYVIIGAPLDISLWPNGAAYIYTNIGGIWSHQSDFGFGEIPDYNYFGVSVGITPQYAVAGATDDWVGESIVGSAYLVTNTSSGWTYLDRLTSSDGIDGDNFGASVSIFDDRIVVSATGNDDNGTNAGAAYIFGPAPSSCESFTVHLHDHQSALLSGGTLEYREGGGTPWQTAEEIEDGVFCIDTERETVGLRMKYGPQFQTVGGVPTNTDYTFQTTNVIVELKDGLDDPVDGGKVTYTSNGWHEFGETGDDGSGYVQNEMLPLQYTFKMKYNRKIERKSEIISGTTHSITYYVDDLKSTQATIGETNDLMAYPNPFNSSTNIAFMLEKAEEVEVAIYDVNGKIVEELHKGLLLSGNHKLKWTTDDVQKGIYIVRLKTNENIYHKNIVKI